MSLLKNKSKVYMYAFNHRTTGSPWPSWSGDALHGFEIDHVFGVPYSTHNDVRYERSEFVLSEQMMTYWTNFAKTGYVNVVKCSLHVAHGCSKTMSSFRQPAAKFK